MNKTTIIIPYDIDRGFLPAAIRSAEHQGDVVLSQSSNSVGHNVNNALKQVKTPYFCILAEDDWLRFDSVRQREARIDGFDFIHSYGVAVFPHKEERIIWTKPDPTIKEMISMNRICGGTTLYKTELVDKFGGWDESLTTAEEYEWHLRLLSGGASLGFVPKETYYYRRHDLQKSLGNTDRHYQEARFKQIREIKDRYVK